MKDITLKEFEKKIVLVSKPSVVKFFHEGCHLCVKLKPIYEQLAEEYENFVSFYIVDTNREEELTKLFSDDGVPTIFYFNNGDATEIPYPADDESGYSRASIENYIKEQLSQ
jgi:thiol-disulfide isomerase/thioredoxin